MRGETEGGALIPVRDVGAWGTASSTFIADCLRRVTVIVRSHAKTHAKTQVFDLISTKPTQERDCQVMIYLCNHQSLMKMTSIWLSESEEVSAV